MSQRNQSFNPYLTCNDTTKAHETLFIYNVKIMYNFYRETYWYTSGKYDEAIQTSGVYWDGTQERHFGPVYWTTSRPRLGNGISAYRIAYVSSGT